MSRSKERGPGVSEYPWIKMMITLRTFHGSPLRNNNLSVEYTLLPSRLSTFEQEGPKYRGEYGRTEGKGSYLEGESVNVRKCV